MIKIEDHLGLVKSAVWLIKSSWKSHYTFDEVESIGFIYLIKASEKFDEAFGCKFSTFAIPVIKCGILNTLRDDKWVYRKRGEKLNITSLNMVINDLDTDVEIQDTLKDSINYEEIIIDKLLVDKLLNRLNERERKVVNLYYFDGINQVDISKSLNISQAHISRILNGAIIKMRRSLDVAS